MFSKNSYLTGILASLIFPAIAWAAAYYFRYTVELTNRPALPYLIAIALNLIMLRLILKKESDKTGRGIMLATFIILILVFTFKAHLR